MKPTDLLGKAIEALPQVIEAIGRAVGSARRSLRPRPPPEQLKPSERRPSEYIHKHYAPVSEVPRRCVYCGVVVTPANEGEHCPEVPV